MKTVVIGASENPERYSNRAVKSLKRHGQEVVAVGIRSGSIEGTEILSGKPAISDVDTVSLYVGPANQPEWYDYILSLKPRRIIFNPGTENPAFEKTLRENGVEVQEACTLVMLSIGNF